MTLPNRDPYKSNESRGRGEDASDELEVEECDAWPREKTDATGDDIVVLLCWGVSGVSMPAMFILTMRLRRRNSDDRLISDGVGGNWGVSKVVESDRFKSEVAACLSW